MVSTGATIGDLIADATNRLRAAGLPDPRHTALRLLGGHRNESVATLLLRAQSPPDLHDTTWLNAAVDRHIDGEPLPYLVGTTGFRHLDLLVDQRALIPRPETESVVGEALAAVQHGIAADIGTGTGAIALSLRHEGHFDRVIGIDYSAEALSLAKENAIRTGLAVEWHLGDLLAPLQSSGTMVNLLVSNPPYLTHEEYGSLDRSVRDYEPELALVSGMDGLTATRRLLDEGRSVVVSGGWLVLELDCRRAAMTAALASQLGWQSVRVHNDLFGRARTLVAQRGPQDD